MSIIKKIWNDSVWSKVIATIVAPYVIAILVALKGFFDESGYLASFKQILGYAIEMPVWLIPIIFLAVIYLTWLIIKHRQNKYIEKNVIRHQGPYITFKDQSQDQCYCAVCWDTKHEKVQLPHYYGDTFKCPKCSSEGCYDHEKKAPSYPPIMRF